MTAGQSGHVRTEGQCGFVLLKDSWSVGFVEGQSVSCGRKTNSVPLLLHLRGNSISVPVLLHLKGKSISVPVLLRLTGKSISVPVLLPLTGKSISVPVLLRLTPCWYCPVCLCAGCVCHHASSYLS